MTEAHRLLGRDQELRQVETLLSHARNGRGGALLLAGEPGIGKTSLLDAATSELTAMEVLRADGYEAESTIPYTALQRLMISLRNHLPVLPEWHRRALRVAAGAAEGPPPDRFLVGLGALGLLAAAGATRPIGCVVDCTGQRRSLNTATPLPSLGVPAASLKPSARNRTRPAR